MKCTIEEIVKIITDTVYVSEDKLDINKPLNEQSDIDSLDCAEIELEIEGQFNLDFSFGETVNPSSTPQEVFDNVQKLLDEKEKDKKADKVAEQKIVDRVRLF